MAWGAGINHWAKIDEILLGKNRKHIRVSSTDVPRFDIAQADVAPLMSSLIGIAVPMNNFGKLPSIYLNCSKVGRKLYNTFILFFYHFIFLQEYTSKAMFNNALQAAEQYKYLHNEFIKGAFSKYLNHYEKLNNQVSLALERRIQTSINNRKYGEAVIHLFLNID